MNIYVIKTKDSKNNYISVGQTTGNVEEYIKRTYRKQATETLFIKYDFDGTDKAIHAELDRLGYKRPAEVNGCETFDFRDENGLKVIKAIIVAIEKHTTHDLQRTEDFPMRAEQKECVEKTIAAFESGSDKFLWNCKMRFGKTFTTYQLMKKANYQNILVLTWKVAVEESWQDDLLSHYDFKGINFINRDTIRDFDKTKRNVVFLSIPLLLANTPKDAKAAEDSESEDDVEITTANVDQFADKIKPIADMNWDLLVIDEAHYGTRAKNTKKILEKIKYKKKLELSGTPFKIIDDAEYHNDEIYNWTYQQEQKAKRQAEKIKAQCS